MSAAEMRELARGHRKAGRLAMAQDLERQAAALDGRGTSTRTRTAPKGAAVKKKPKSRKKKKPVARAANPATKRKRKRKSAKRKTPARAANPAPRRKRKRAKRKTAARTANPAPKRRKRRKAKRKSPSRAANPAPARRRRRKAKRGGVRVGRRTKRKVGRRRARRTTTVSVRTSNPSGSWTSVAVTTVGVGSGILGAMVLDRFVATKLSADEIKQVEGDGGKQAGAQGRDAMRRILQKPGAARILSVLAMSGLAAGASAALGKKYPLPSDYLIGYAAGSAGYMGALVVLTRVFPMMPGKVVDGPEVTWQNRIIPEYQDVPQTELAAYLANVNNAPQVIDSETNRMDAAERYDRMGMPFDLGVEHSDSTASTGGSDTASKASIEAGGKTINLSGAGDLAGRRSASSNPNSSKIMAARQAAQAAARVYNERYGAPTLGCGEGCKSPKSCKGGCKDDHSHDEPTTITTSTGGSPPSIRVDRSAPPPAPTDAPRENIGIKAPPPRENTGIKALPPGGGVFSETPRSSMTTAPAPTREAAILISRTRSGWGNTSPPPPRTAGRYPGRRAALAGHQPDPDVGSGCSPLPVHPSCLPFVPRTPRHDPTRRHHQARTPRLFGPAPLVGGQSPRLDQVPRARAVAAPG